MAIGGARILLARASFSLGVRVTMVGSFRTCATTEHPDARHLLNQLRMKVNLEDIVLDKVSPLSQYVARVMLDQRGRTVVSAMAGM